MDKKLESDLLRENITIANNSKRIKAYVIDEILISLIIFASFWGKFSNEEDILVIIETVNSLFFAVIALKIIYHAFFTYMYGATIGKIITKTVIISCDSLAKPEFIPALTRSIIRILSEMLFYFGFFWAFFNDEKQTWHDKIAKTIVVDV